MKRLMLFAVLMAVGCAKSDAPVANNQQPLIDTATKDVPTFIVANSEYPSWSVLSVAADNGLIKRRDKERGPLEQKWGVDIVLKTPDYDGCIALYGSNTVDAVCITNIDSLNPAIGRPSTAIVPTSTSFGADALLTIGIDNLDDLANTPVMMLKGSVSEYAFVRCLEKEGKDPNKYQITHKDPDAAAIAMQTGKSKAIMVWNPMVLQTLRLKPEAKRVFDSTMIPGEIVDMIVVGNDSLKKVGGEDFACCLADVYYAVNRQLADPATADETYIALGANFCKLDLEDMKRCCVETKFYSTPEAGIEVFSSEDFRRNNEQVVKTWKERKIINQAPTLGYDDPSANLNFSTKYMKRVIEQQ